MFHLVHDACFIQLSQLSLQLSPFGMPGPVDNPVWVPYAGILVSMVGGNDAGVIREGLANQTVLREGVSIRAL